MAYTLEAFVLKSAAASEAVKAFPSAVVVPLDQDLSLIPLTDAFSVALEAHYGAGLEIEFDDLSPLLGSGVQWAAAASAAGPVAFLEAEFFGGQGSQAAIGWQAGRITFGPSEANHAINEALRWLGVTPAESLDEFDTVRLGRFRATEEWAKG
jgi:hypothetical protein